MAKVEMGIRIEAPVEKVFGYLEDPATNPEWLPGMVEVRDIARTEEGVGGHFKWVYKMAGMTFEGESKTTEFVRNERMVVDSKGGIASRWTWTFAPHEGGTRLDLVVDYTVPVPVLGRLAEALVLKQNEREANLALVNIKTRMEVGE
jgi:uncharacterized protein YndB with AHSA1/START domain